MSKFDKYFKLQCSSARPSVELDFGRIPLLMYNPKGEKIYLSKVIQHMDIASSDIIRHYIYHTENGTTVFCSNEDEMLLEEELYFNKTTMGKLIYV